MGRLARGRALLNEFASAGVPADKVVYNGLLFVCARDKASSLADGYAVVEDTEAAGQQPDAPVGHADPHALAEIRDYFGVLS